MCHRMHGVFKATLSAVLLLAIVRESATSLVACPSTADGNVLLAHQFECSTFFLCDRTGAKPSYLLRCPIGTYFNVAGTSGTCALASEVNCQPTLSVGRAGYSRSSVPLLPPIESPDSYRNYTMYLPHPRNCSQFYKHEGWNEPHLYECPRNLRFDPVLEVCDLPLEVDCRGRECQQIGEPVCPPVNSSSLVHLPHPTDCGAYYTCDWGDAILEHCPDGLYFNPALGVCDWPRNVECNRCPQWGSRDEETTDRERF